MIPFTHEPLNLFTNYVQAAQKFPESAIVLDEPLRAFPELHTTTTYQASLEIIKQRAYQLAALGVKKGDAILIYKSPRFDTYLLAVAASYLGAIPAMISYHLPQSTIEVFLERLDDPFVVYDEETAIRIDPITYDETKKISVETLLNTVGKIVPQAQLAIDEISYMTHTSGTTGVPKLICHSANSMGWRTVWQKTVMAKMEGRRIVAFHISPVHSRFNIGISSLMALGFPMLPIANPELNNVAQLLKAYHPMALETHPNHFVQWTRLAKEQPEVFAKTRYYHSTFDAINNQTMAAFLKASKAQDPVFLQVYGQSECGPMILKAHQLNTLTSSNARDMGVGLEDLTKARICDEQGRELPRNTDGHIQFLSKGRALTYYKEDERFQNTVFGTWWDSGDYGCMNDEGHLYLKDRQVDLIDEVESTLAIEDYLLDHLPFLAEVVLVRGKEHKAQPVLALIEGEAMDEEQWFKAVSDLPQLHHPVVMAWEDIPRTATMKVQRLQLEKQFQ